MKKLHRRKVMKLKDNLKDLRKKANLTQEELARKMHVRQYNISDYEIGRIEPNVQALIKLADIYNTSIDYLVGRTKRREKFVQNKESKDKYIEEIEDIFSTLTDNQKKKIVETISFLVTTYKN